jgi:competence protein ComEC
MVSSRPALFAALLLIAGVVLALHIDLSLKTALGICAGALLLCGALFLFRAPFWSILLLLSASLIALGFLRGTDSLARAERREVADFALKYRMVTTLGRLERIEQQSASRQCFLLSDAMLIAENDTLTLRSLRLEMLGAMEAETARPGDWLVARGALRVPEDPRVPGQLGHVRDAVMERVAAYVYTNDSTKFFVIHSGHASLARSVQSLRTKITDILKRDLSPRAFALCNALLLGDRSGFSREFNDQIRATGLSHIFALSGLNVGLVASIVWLIAALLCLPYSLRIWLALGATAFYVALGFAMPSLVRAGIMAILFLVSQLIHRKAHVLNIIGAAAFLELLWRPMDLVDIGFQLSYLAVLGMVLTYSWLRSTVTKALGFQLASWRMLRPILEVGFATMGAQIGTLPLLAAVFGTIPFVGLLANLVAVPAFSILLWWEIFLLIAAPVSHAIAASMGATINMSAELLHRFVEWFSSLPGASLPVGHFSLVALLGTYLGLGLIFFQLKKIHWKRVTVGVLIILNALIWPGVFQWRNARFEVYFFDVGDGDSILLRSPSGKAILIDAGPAFESWDASWRILPALKNLGIGHLDALILTHAETDHIGGAANILRELPVSAIYTNGLSHPTWAYEELVRATNEQRIEMKAAKAGEVIECLQPFPIWILSPDSLWWLEGKNQNQRALALRVGIGSTAALFTADIDSATEQRLLPWGDFLESDLLKVAHHGSAGSSSAPFLNVVRPQLAIITAGRHNPHGHPSEGVIRRLNEMNIPYCTTGEQGTILCASDGETFHTASWRRSSLAHEWHLPTD